MHYLIRSAERHDLPQLQKLLSERTFGQQKNLLPFAGKELAVVSRSGLIKMKTLAEPPQDIVDIERLENAES